MLQAVPGTRENLSPSVSCFGQRIQGFAGLFVLENPPRIGASSGLCSCSGSADGGNGPNAPVRTIKTSPFSVSLTETLPMGTPSSGGAIIWESTGRLSRGPACEEELKGGTVGVEVGD